MQLRTYKNLNFLSCDKQFTNAVIDPFNPQFYCNLFSLTRTAIGRNKSRDLFQPIVVVASEKNEDRTLLWVEWVYNSFSEFFYHWIRNSDSCNVFNGANVIMPILI